MAVDAGATCLWGSLPTKVVRVVAAACTRSAWPRFWWKMLSAPWRKSFKASRPLGGAAWLTCGLGVRSKWESNPSKSRGCSQGICHLTTFGFSFSVSVFLVMAPKVITFYFRVPKGQLSTHWRNVDWVLEALYSQGNDSGCPGS